MELIFWLDEATPEVPALSSRTQTPGAIHGDIAYSR
jgi:hypothetical protein